MSFFPIKFTFYATFGTFSTNYTQKHQTSLRIDFRHQKTLTTQVICSFLPTAPETKFQTWAFFSLRENNERSVSGASYSNEVRKFFLFSSLSCEFSLSLLPRGVIDKKDRECREEGREGRGETSFFSFSFSYFFLSLFFL